MKRNIAIFAVLLCALLTACGRAQEETAPTAETFVMLTETAATELSTEPETTVETTLPTETEPVTETAAPTETLPETTEVVPSDLPPQLLHWDARWNCYTVSIELGDHSDLSEHLSFGDDHDPHPTMTWEGTYDPDEPDFYPVTVTLTDNMGNTADYEVTVNVPWEKMHMTTPFSTFRETHAGQHCGIDVSKWQGNIDFDKVKAEGAEFVLMRIGYGDSGCEMDAYFTQNFERARAAGLAVGVYFYSTAGSPDAARQQADWIADQLGGASLDFPVAYDWENFKHFQDWGMSFDELNAIYAAFSERMAENGYDTMLYAEPKTLGTAWTTADKTIWLADYGNETAYTGDYLMRQVWNCGRIDGIDGEVDMNVCADLP